MADDKKLTPRAQDFSAWYNEVVVRAELADYSPQQLVDSTVAARLNGYVGGKGSLAQAMRATMAIPGVVTPVNDENWLLVDGGALNNIPADVTKKMGADTVIAVNVGADSATEEQTRASLVALLGRTIDTMMTTSIRNWPGSSRVSCTAISPYRRSPSVVSVRREVRPSRCVRPVTPRPRPRRRRRQADGGRWPPQGQPGCAYQ